MRPPSLAGYDAIFELRCHNGAMYAARKQADSSPLPVAREALCGAVGNVLAVLCLHMRMILDDEGLSTLPPPPSQLYLAVRTLPRHLHSSAERQPANVWIAMLFDATRMDLWCVPVTLKISFSAAPLELDAPSPTDTYWPCLLYTSPSPRD